MDGLVNLPPDDPRAREAIIALLGTTLSELKEIDKNVVGSSRNISALKTDLKNVFNFQQSPPTATVVNAGINVETSPQPLPPAAPYVAPVSQQSAVIPLQTGSSTQEQSEDSNQLVFDFNQKITPDTINNKLDRILDKLEYIANLLKS